MNPKSWYTSKTLWLNSLAAIAMLVQTFTGFVIAPEEQGAVLAILNLILRIVTTKPLGA